MLAPRFKTSVQFDRSVLKKRWKRINETPLKKAGLQVRKIARGSIRRTKKKTPSPKGTPPRSRHKSGAIKLIFSVPEISKSRVLVGFLGFGNTDPPVPGLLEHGGKAVRRVFPKARGRKPKSTKVPRKTIKKVVTYPERPTMTPALEKAQPSLPSLWAGSVK